jgi:hypothetical protein
MSAHRHARRYGRPAIKVGPTLVEVVLAAVARVDPEAYAQARAAGASHADIKAAARLGLSPLDVPAEQRAAIRAAWETCMLVASAGGAASSGAEWVRNPGWRDRAGGGRAERIAGLINAAPPSLIRLIIALAAAFKIYYSNAGEFDAARALWYDRPGGAGLVDLFGLLDEVDLDTLREVLDVAVDVQRGSVEEGGL